MLLEKHPAMVTVDELDALMPDVPRIGEAVEHLVRAGVATRVGDLVGASRAAVRTDQLAI